VPVSKKERLEKELHTAIAQGDLELALAVTEDLVDHEPEDSRHHTSRGVVLAKLGRLEEALDELDEALDIDREDERAWYSKGCILMDAGKLRPSLACFYKSLDIDPGHLKSRNRFLKCLSLMQGEGRDIEHESEIIHDGPSLVKEEQDGRQLEEDEGPSWMDMISETGSPSQKREKEPVFERPPLPEEEPDIFDDRDRGASLLDEEMFDDEYEETEDWEEGGDEVDFEEEGWEDEEEGGEEWEDSEPVGTLSLIHI
jgi:tetratricopeptide (TPR) repeat protein